MRRLALLAVVCAGMAAGADRKQVETLIQQVRDVTGAEPALLSVDTQIRLAAATAKLHPRKALEAARDAASLLLTLPDAGTRGQLGVRLAEVLRQIDPEEARRFVLSMEPRAVSGAYRDTKAEALDFVVRYWIPRDRKRAVEVLSEGIGAGAFRVESVRELMDLLLAEEPSAVPGLFAVLLAAFPEADATDRDCLLLLRRAAQVAPADSALAVEAARKILRALDSKRFQEDPEWRVAGQYTVDGSTVKAESAREAILLEVAGLLAAFSPQTYKQYAERFSLDLAAAKSISATSDLKLSPRDQQDREDSPLATLMLRGRPAPSLTELVQPSYTETVEAALERARLEGGGASAAQTLVEIAMRRDATPAQRAQISGEAIDEAEKDPLLYSRLWVYEGLLPYWWQHGNRPLAMKAGQAMARTVARFCKCEDRACGSLKERAECLTANQRVAEDLFNFEIAPEDLGIGDPSLRARSLLLKLREMTRPEAAK
jgi:hypothetical protein